MGTQRDHLSKSAENEIFANSLDASQAVPAGWAVTALFYSAVHQVQSYLVAHGSVPVTHTVRNSAIQRDPKLKPIYIDYREMETQSRTARYDTVPTLKSDVEIVCACLERIKNRIQAII